jgi:hypothetical protein
VQDPATLVTIVRAAGSGKERRIEEPTKEPHLVQALRDAYESILSEIADEEAAAA